jgi:cysteine desulfurase / selenocysteine lyase
MDWDRVRDDFPMLGQQKKTPPLIYLDNACMSLRPQQVIDEISRYYTSMSACAGRSNHRLARAVADAVEKSRDTIARFIGAKYKEEVIFTRNTSEGFNLVAHSLALTKGDIVVTSDKEHNSNLVPWLQLVKTVGITHKVVKSKADNTFDMEALTNILEQKQVKLVSLTHTANLDGVTFPINDIAAVVHRAGALLMVDGAQSVPHKEVDVTKLDIDFLAFSGHKLCGPSGMGVLYGKRALLEKLEGFMVGGDTVDYTTYTDFRLLPIPEKFEAGLQDYAGIMGMATAIDYVTKIGMRAIEVREKELNQIMTDGLVDEERIRVIGPLDSELRSGIFSFWVEGVNPHQISLLLDESYGIMVRSGQHCVHSWFHDQGIPGSVRASAYFYNTPGEANRFVEAVKQILMIV